MPTNNILVTYGALQVLYCIVLYCIVLHLIIVINVCRWSLRSRRPSWCQQHCHQESDKFVFSLHYLVLLIMTQWRWYLVCLLVKSKCLPILPYSLEACPLTKTDLKSLEFVINKFFMKLFRTNNIDTVKICQSQFCFELPCSVIKNVP